MHEASVEAFDALRTFAEPLRTLIDHQTVIDLSDGMSNGESSRGELPTLIALLFGEARASPRFWTLVKQEMGCNATCGRIKGCMLQLVCSFSSNLIFSGSPSCLFWMLALESVVGTWFVSNCKYHVVLHCP